MKKRNFTFWAVLMLTANFLPTVTYAQPGSLDLTFSSDGKVTTDFLNTEEGGLSIAIQSDGKIVVAGSSASKFALVRYNPNGSLDNTFDNDGKVTTDFGNSGESFYAVAIQSDDKIVAVGTSSNGSNSVITLVRYYSNGTLDTDFGSGGIVTSLVGMATE